MNTSVSCYVLCVAQTKTTTKAKICRSNILKYMVCFDFITFK